jgi:RNA polymerase sigma-70 factor, ECF subfamily
MPEILLDDDVRRLASLRGSDAAAREAFWQSVRPHSAAMARLAARLSPDADRDEIVQEALARAWQKRATFDPERGAFAAWLLAITADRARHARRRRIIPPIPVVDVEEAPSDDRIDVEAAVARLPSRQRLAVNCFYFADLSIPQTAAVMGCAEGTVKSTLSDARTRLRHMLEIHDVDS